MDEIMDRPSCRFCGALTDKQTVKGEHVYGGTPEHHFYCCSECDMIYLYPTITEERESEFYAEEFEGFMHDRSGDDIDWSAPERHFKRNRREADRRMEFLKDYIRPGGKALEIGCSSGFMLDVIREEGMDVFGIEPSRVFGEYARSKGVEVMSDLQSLAESRSGPFDLVIHYYVLEHIRNPVLFLKELFRFITPGGAMVFEVPSATEPLIELYDIDAFDRFYWSIAHHWYFTPKSLSAVIDKVDKPFNLFPEQRYDISNHMVWMQYGKPGGLGRYSNVFGKELDRLYKERLKSSWLCDTIIAVIRA